MNLRLKESILTNFKIPNKEKGIQFVSCDSYNFNYEQRKRNFIGGNFWRYYRNNNFWSAPVYREKKKRI